MDGISVMEGIFDDKGNWQISQNIGKFIPKTIQEFYYVQDNPTIVDLKEFNSFENYEQQEFEIEGFYVEGQDIKELTFNKDLSDNIFKYINILFDAAAEFDIKINTKNIYGNLVGKDESSCE